MIKNDHNLQTILHHNKHGITNQEELIGTKNIEVQLDEEENKETLSKHEGLRSRHESFEVIDGIDPEAPIDVNCMK